MQSIALRCCATLCMLACVLVPTSGPAQGGVRVTEAQVQKAVEELDKLAQQESANNVVPGLAMVVISI